MTLSRAEQINLAAAVLSLVVSVVTVVGSACGAMLFVGYYGGRFQNAMQHAAEKTAEVAASVEEVDKLVRANQSDIAALKARLGVESKRAND